MAETTELQRRIDEALTACAICGKIRKDHEGLIHAFTTTPHDLREKPAEKPAGSPPRQVIAVDIALRLALVDAGVLDAESIVAAEEKLGLSASVAPVGQQGSTGSASDGH